MDNKTDKVMDSLTESQLLQIEKVVYERVPMSKAERNGTWCSAEKMTVTRLRRSMRKKLIEEYSKEKIER